MGQKNGERTVLSQVGMMHNFYFLLFHTFINAVNTLQKYIFVFNMVLLGFD